MSILCIGQCAYDITFPIHTPLVENQKYRIYDKFECAGAPAANASILCAMWEEKAQLISRLGNDFYGKEILHILEANGVDTSYICMDEEFSTPISAIISNSSNGTRTIFNCPGRQRELAFQYPCNEVDVILVDGHEIQASLIALHDYKGVPSIMDAGTYKEETKELAQRVDYLVCSQDFARQYTGLEIDVEDKETWKRSFKLLHELNPNHIVITLGEDGLLYEEQGVLHHLPAYNVEAVDTTGAGDIFHGAFAYCIKKGYEVKDALIICSATSAISVQTLGGQTSIPTKDEVNEFLCKHGERIQLC